MVVIINLVANVIIQVMEHPNNLFQTIELGFKQHPEALIILIIVILLLIGIAIALPYYIKWFKDKLK